jgi:hypothetical protein
MIYIQQHEAQLKVMAARTQHFFCQAFLEITLNIQPGQTVGNGKFSGAPIETRIVQR